MEPSMTGGDQPDASADWLTGQLGPRIAGTTARAVAHDAAARYVAIASRAARTAARRRRRTATGSRPPPSCWCIPYNAVFDLVLRRTGMLTPVIAFSDQVLAVASGLRARARGSAAVDHARHRRDDAVSFGRRIAGQSAFVGALGAGLLILINRPPDGGAAFLVYLAAGAFIVLVVGGISEVEREVRGRYAELMSGIDAVVWEQLTRHPSTLYVNQKAEELLGHPPSAWRQPGFWGRTVHPDDRPWATKVYRDAIRRGENAELEYRMIATDGRDRLGPRPHAGRGRRRRTSRARPRRDARRHRAQARRGAGRPVRRTSSSASSSRSSCSVSDERRARGCTAINPEASLITGMARRSRDGPHGRRAFCRSSKWTCCATACSTPSPPARAS